MHRGGGVHEAAALVDRRVAEIGGRVGQQGLPVGGRRQDLARVGELPGRLGEREVAGDDRTRHAGAAEDLGVDVAVGVARAGRRERPAPGAEAHDVGPEVAPGVGPAARPGDDLVALVGAAGGEVGDLREEPVAGGGADGDHVLEVGRRALGALSGAFVALGVDHGDAVVDGGLKGLRQRVGAVRGNEGVAQAARDDVDLLGDEPLDAAHDVGVPAAAHVEHLGHDDLGAGRHAFDAHGGAGARVVDELALGGHAARGRGAVAVGVLQAVAGEVAVAVDGGGEVGVRGVGAGVEHAHADALALDGLAVHLDGPGVLGVGELQRFGFDGRRRGGRGRRAGRAGRLAGGTPGLGDLGADTGRCGNAHLAVGDHVEDVAVAQQLAERGPRDGGGDAREVAVAVDAGGVVVGQPVDDLAAVAVGLEDDDDLDGRLGARAGGAGRPGPHDGAEQRPRHHDGHDDTDDGASPH